MTAQENDIPAPESQSDGDAAFDQGDIDSMFGSDASSEETSDQGAVSAQSEPTQSDEPVADEASIDQSSIDAMFGGDETAAPQEAVVEPASTGAAGEGAAVVDQSDIDALFGGDDSDGAAVGDDAPSSEPAAQDTRVDTLGRPFDAAAAEMAAAIAEEKEAAAAAAPPPPPPVQTEAVSLEDFGDKSLGAIDPRRVTMLSDVKLRVRVELGRSRMLVEDVLQLGEGSVVELQKAAGDPVDIIVNERLIARGEVLVLNDNFCVRISEIVATDPHRVTV